MHPIIYCSMEGHEEITVSFWGNKRPTLRAKISASDEDRIHAFTHHRVDFFQVFQGDLTLSLENLVDIITAGNGAHVPFRHITYPLGVFEPGGGNQGNIAKSRSAKVRQDSFIGVVRELPGTFSKMRQVARGYRSKFLQIIFRVQVFFIEDRKSVV